MLSRAFTFPHPTDYDPEAPAGGEEPMSVTINGASQAIQPAERVIDLINRSGVAVPHVCYHPQLGPIQTCDTCMVEVDGKLVRACGAVIAEGMKVSTNTAAASAAQRTAFDRLLQDHMLYCTVCD